MREIGRWLTLAELTVVLHLGALCDLWAARCAARLRRLSGDGT